MKQLILGITFYSFMAFSSFNLSSTVDNTTLVESEDFRTVPCQWRTGIRIDGIWYWSQWISGECNKGEDGTLYPIR
jgi:hypothetical protein